MKKLLTLALLCLVLVACGGEDKEIIMYKMEDGQIMTQKEVNEVKDGVIKQFSEKFPNASVSESVLEEEKVGDTLYKSIKINVDLGNIDDKNDLSMDGSQPEPTLLVNVGDQMPMTTLTLLDGSSLNTTDYAGKPTLYNFWFTTCKPCIDEMPELDELREKYQDRVNFISVTFNTPLQVNKFLEKHDFAFAKAVSAQDYIDELGIKSFPRNIFVDKDGKIQFIEYGLPYEMDESGEMVAGNADAFENYLTQML